MRNVQTIMFYLFLLLLLPYSVGALFLIRILFYFFSSNLFLSLIVCLVYIITSLLHLLAPYQSFYFIF